MQWSELGEQSCSFSRTLSVVGDRWTLLILRDCFMKIRRFEEFHARLGIGRPILTERLNKLVKHFVLTKVAYQQNPTRYEYRLTEKGLDLYPIIMAMVHWGDVHMGDRKGRPVLHHHITCGHEFDPVTTCSVCTAEIDPRDVRVLEGPGARSEAHLPPVAERAVRPVRVGRAKLASGQKRR